MKSSAKQEGHPRAKHKKLVSTVFPTRAELKDVWPELFIPIDVLISIAMRASSFGSAGLCVLRAWVLDTRGFIAGNLCVGVAEVEFDSVRLHHFLTVCLHVSRLAARGTDESPLGLVCRWGCLMATISHVHFSPTSEATDGPIVRCRSASPFAFRISSKIPFSSPSCIFAGGTQQAIGIR